MTETTDMTTLARDYTAAVKAEHDAVHSQEQAK